MDDRGYREEELETSVMSGGNNHETSTKKNRCQLLPISLRNREVG